MSMECVRALAIDVDGTLTDGRYTVSSSGEVMKSFHTYDFWAISKAAKDGFPILIITSADDGVIRQKLAMLECKDIDLIEGSPRKCLDVAAWLKSKELDFGHLLFIGDAENDLETMRAACCVACPKNAVADVQKIAEEISTFCGGDGAVYDIIRTLYLSTDMRWNA